MAAPAEIALIFDLDNTLIETRIDFLRIRHRLIEMLHAAGATRRAREDLVALALPELVTLGREASVELADRMWAVIQEAEDGGLEGAAPVAHAGDVLVELRRRGYRLGLLTNNARAGTTARLRILGLEGFFDAVATRDEVRGLKPLPDGVTFLHQRFPGTSRVYVIGDAWIDGRAAEAAGARFIGFGAKEADIRARGVKPWAWVRDLRDLLSLKLDE